MAGKEDAGHSGKDSGDSGLGALFSPPNARLSTGGSGELQIVERVVRETESAAHFTPLTRTNYAEWTILMKVQLQALGLWDVVEDGPGDFREDRRAMSILLRAVPPELIRTLGGKETAKEAWDTLKVMRIGVERVREAKAQTRWTEFEKLAFREGEGVESFGIRLTAIVNDLEVLGDPVTEHKAVLKFLRSVPRQYKQMAMAIESLVDLKSLSIEELTGRLLVVEERGELDEPTHAGAQLLLTEDEWRDRQQLRERSQGSSSGGDEKSSDSDKEKSSPNKGDNGKRKGNCRYCGKPGHWARECNKAKRDREQKEQANLVRAESEDDEPTLLMAQVCMEDLVAVDGVEEVFLNEEKVVPVVVADGVKEVITVKRV